MKRELTIVIPAYNEEDGIGQTLRDCKTYCPNAKILVIDDCSSDNTPRILQRFSKDKKISFIRNSTNLGYGGALKVGFRNAKTGYIAFLDADGTYPPRFIPELINQLEMCSVDVVWGTRLNYRSEMPFIRKIGNYMLSIIFFIWTQSLVFDICSGMRVFKKEALEAIKYETLPNGLDMITAMSKRIIKSKYYFGTMPISYEKREGSSKLNLVKDFIRMAKNIFVE